MALTRIDKYEVMYSANSFFPQLWLKGGTEYIGQLIFMPNGSALPADNISKGVVKLYYHLDDFQNAIDILRNEKPVFLLYSGSGGGFENGIRTIAAKRAIVKRGKTRGSR